MLKEIAAEIVHAPLLVKTGAVIGLFAGLSMGLVVSSPAGVPFGMMLGTFAGIVAGIALDSEEKRRGRRTRQLDDIIGVTSGNLGARGSIPPESTKERELRRWMTEWMTPPTPGVR
jgi:hypothetical protein